MSFFGIFSILLESSMSSKATTTAAEHMQHCWGNLLRDIVIEPIDGPDSSGNCVAATSAGESYLEPRGLTSQNKYGGADGTRTWPVCYW